MDESPTTQLLAKIDAFLKASQMSETYFGKLAVNNSEVVKRLRAGRTVTLTTQASIESFIAKRYDAMSAAGSKDAA